MTKSIKKIFAVLLVVATLALMIPFSASAAREASTEVTFSVDSDVKAKTFKFEIYKIASITLSNGKVTSLIDDDTVTNAIKAAGSDENTQTLIAACKASSKLGQPVHTWDDNNLTVTYTDLGAGIYYVHPVAKGVSTKANDSIVTLPDYKNNEWTPVGTVNLADKVSTTNIELYKTITNSDSGSTEYTTAGVGDTVNFELKASVPGSTASKLLKYNIYDSLDSGLEFNANSVVVKYDGVALTKDTDYKIITTGIDSKYTFGIEFQPVGGYIPNKFYSDSYQDNVQRYVTVEYNATVLSTANFFENSNNNQVFLNYKNADHEDTEDGPKVQVFTFKLQLVKVDASDSNKKLKGATFELYNKAKSKVIETGETDAKGEIVFSSLLAKGTYYVKETVAPEGYVLPTGDAVWTEISIDPTIKENSSLTKKQGRFELTNLANNFGEYVQYTVKNTKITVPSTGGMGTTIFTICGASLIVLAGVMFVVLKKKKTSK